MLCTRWPGCNLPIPSEIGLAPVEAIARSVWCAPEGQAFAEALARWRTRTRAVLAIRHCRRCHRDLPERRLRFAGSYSLLRLPCDAASDGRCFRKLHRQGFGYSDYSRRNHRRGAQRRELAALRGVWSTATSEAAGRGGRGFGRLAHHPPQRDARELGAPGPVLIHRPRPRPRLVRTRLAGTAGGRRRLILTRAVPARTPSAPAGPRLIRCGSKSSTTCSCIRRKWRGACHPPPHRSTSRNGWIFSPAHLFDAQAR